MCSPERGSDTTKSGLNLSVNRHDAITTHGSAQILGYFEVSTFKGKPGSVDEVIDLSDVASKRPELAGAFCYYLETACNRGVGSTRKQVVKYFRAFNSFLDVYEATFGIATATLSDLSSVIVRGYADWLDGSDIVMSTLKLTNITKNNRYNALKRFIRHCQRSEIYRERISQTISFRTAWKARRRPSTSARSLTIVHLQALRRECRTRISATRQELEQSAHIIADPSITVPDLSCKSPAPFAFPPVQLKAAAHAFQVNRLSDDFRDAMPGLARTLRKPYGATGDIISRLYLTVDTIVPFMIMIGLPLCFNATGLVTLQRKNVRRGRGLLGDERVFVLGLKDRAGRRQRRSFPVDDADPFSISSLLEFVQKHADRLRDHVENRYSDCVFVAASRRGERPKGFFDENNDVLNCLKRALKQFLDTLKIPSFTINDLRVIGADVAALMSDGDIKVQQILLQHQSIATTRDHYQTEQAARARQEQLAHLMNERERLITSSSRIDPRNAGTKNGLYRAATHGFDCLDALNSPIKGQRPGTLCSAYGKCPRCPRAVLYPSTANAARLLQINERFEQARNVLNQTRWTIEWDLEHKMLREFWLLLIPKEVLTDARLLELPPVPLIE